MNHLYNQRAAICLLGILPLMGAPCFAGQTSDSPGPAPKELATDAQLLAGSRAVFGKVLAITSDQIKLDIGEVEPRYIPAKPAKEKGLEHIRPGDMVLVILNEQNLLVDFHPADASDRSSHHRIVSGTIAQNLSVGHDRVVIQSSEGRQESHEIRSQARSKVASIPVGVPALFLVDESNKISDATFANTQAAKDAHRSVEEKSPLKGAQRRIDGTVSQTLQDNHITIRTQEGKEQRFEIRPLMKDRIAALTKGESVVLLVDPSEQVFDLAIPPQSTPSK